MITELIAGCIGFIIGGGMGIVAMVMIAVTNRTGNIMLKEEQYNEQ